jgi:hypothetical protein
MPAPRLSRSSRTFFFLEDTFNEATCLISTSDIVITYVLTYMYIDRVNRTIFRLQANKCDIEKSTSTMYMDVWIIITSTIDTTIATHTIMEEMMVSFDSVKSARCMLLIVGSTTLLSISMAILLLVFLK